MARRRSTVRRARATASDFPRGAYPKSFELENRVARLELLFKDVRIACEILNKRLTALQAQIDHVTARLTAI